MTNEDIQTSELKYALKGLTLLEDYAKDQAKAGYEAAFLSELVGLRIEVDTEDSPFWRLLWQKAHATRSTIETGKTSAGSKIVLVSHLPSYLSEVENIRTAINAGLRNGAVFVPEDNFQQRVKLAEQGEKRAYIIPYEKLKASRSGAFPVDSALEHPLILPFLGVNETQAKQYLENHKQFCGSSIGVWYCDDFVAGETYGRLLILGDSSSNNGIDNLIGNVFLNHWLSPFCYGAPFVWLRRRGVSVSEPESARGQT